MDEGCQGQAGIGPVRQTARRPVPTTTTTTAPKVDRHRPRALLEEDGRHVTADELADLGPVGRDQRRLIPTPVRERGDAEQTRSQSSSQGRPRNPYAAGDQSQEQQRDHHTEPTPPHSPLPPLPPNPEQSPPTRAGPKAPLWALHARTA